MQKIRIAVICAVVILALSIGIFWYYHPTHYKYNDRHIIGSTVGEITQEYGQFSRVFRNRAGEISCGIYKVRDDTPEMLFGDGYDNSLWYEIYFENGIAVRVRLQEGWYGG